MVLLAGADTKKGSRWAPIIVLPKGGVWGSGVKVFCCVTYKSERGGGRGGALLLRGHPFLIGAWLARPSSLTVNFFNWSWYMYWIISVQELAPGFGLLYDNHILHKHRYIKGYNLITMNPCPQKNMLYMYTAVMESLCMFLFTRQHISIHYIYILTYRPPIPGSKVFDYLDKARRVRKS